VTEYKRCKDKKKRKKYRKMIEQYNWDYKNLGNLKRNSERSRIDGLQIQIIEITKALDISLFNLSEEDLLLTVLRDHYDWTDDQIIKEVKRRSKRDFINFTDHKSK
jgi:hypothetical protein